MELYLYCFMHVANCDQLFCWYDCIGKKAQLSERAMELLALPDDGVPRLLLDIGKIAN
jgi:hypothetical protein